ncbi:hypothetical protein OW763_15810 [Clostridium aestuarii]|uniref:Uncharacterized protein n=1 Tax=Clostridium aestuarii TaxID=338193 RepID=A0ABT4D3H6_9CLOT|nr:hypothetical protein [Clostridium aestuarii]MCY6485786.1 hypothetical protein [Clostridium aestuarii]
MNVKNNKNIEKGKMHKLNHQIEKINDKHNPVTNEDEFAVIGNNTELKNDEEVDPNIESNPFPFSEEKNPFFEGDTTRL